MSAITKAVPKALLTGIRDESRRALVPEPYQIPQHLPLLFLLTERGPLTPQLVDGTAFNRIYGSESLNPRARYYNHQSALAATIMGNANQVFVQRVQPATGSGTAVLRFSVEVVRTTLETYQRNTDGSFALDVDGNRTVVGNVEGYNLIWRRNVKPSGQTALGSALLVNPYRTEDGVINMSTYEDVNSVLYPILDLEVTHFGAYGNNVGLRLTAPNTDDFARGDTAAMANRRAYLYRFTCLEKPVDSNTAQIIETNGGDLNIDLTFKESVTHPITGVNLNFSDMFINSYQEIDVPGQAPKYGPFGRVHVYQENLETVLNLLCRGETAAEHDTRTGTTPGIVTAASLGEAGWDSAAQAFGRSAEYAFAQTRNTFLMNPFTAIDLNGVPFQTVSVDLSATQGNARFTENTIHYGTNGNDGLTAEDDQAGRLKNLHIYDSRVKTWMSTFGVSGQLGLALTDEAKYPFSAIWDSGFSIETKKKLLTVLGARKDVYVVLSPQAVAEYDDPMVPVEAEFDFNKTANSQTTENSQAVALRTAASLYPESIIDGTPTCRAIIIGQAGYLYNSLHTGLLPLTLDFAFKVSRYMGAGNGRWVSEYSFDESPANQVSMFKNVNLTWRSESNYIKDWDAGLNWVQNYDLQSLFYPAFQTVYSDDTSVLNSFMTMAACVELEHVAQRVWRDLTGGSKLTREQFIQRSNDLIIERTKDRFDGRFVIQPETYFTEADDARGYSWTCRIHIYANNMRTVGTYTIVAHRMEDLAA